jgi:hypothetical protein
MAGKKITGDELSARAKANDYQRGAHRDEDSRRARNKPINKVESMLDTKELHWEVLAPSQVGRVLACRRLLGT